MALPLLSFTLTTGGFHNVSSVPLFLFSMLAMQLCNAFILYLLPESVIRNSAVIQMYFSSSLRWMLSCHLGALPCEMGGRTTASLMSQTNMRLDRSSVRKYQTDLCMRLCAFFFFLLHSHIEFMFQYSQMFYILFMNYFKLNWILFLCRFGLAFQTVSLSEWQIA